MVPDAGHRVRPLRRLWFCQEVFLFTGRRNSGCLARNLCAVLLIGAPSISPVVLPQRLTVGLLSFPGRLSLKQAGMPLCFSLHFANPFLLVASQPSTLTFHLPVHLLKQSHADTPRGTADVFRSAQAREGSLILAPLRLPRGPVGCMVSISPSSTSPSYRFPLSTCELSPLLNLESLLSKSMSRVTVAIPGSR